MAFSVVKVGDVQAARADRVAIAPYLSDSPIVITVVWNGNRVKHTLWDLIPNGDLLANEVDSKLGGPELAVASFSKMRAVSMHRSGPAAALKFEAWQAGNVFSLDDDQVWVNDRDPAIVPFGGDPGLQTGSPAAALPHPPPQPNMPFPDPGIETQFGPKAGHAVVASVTPLHHLRISLWRFDNGGQIKVPVSKYAEADGGEATSIAITKVKEHWTDQTHLSGVEVVTASSSDGHLLRVKRWRVNLGNQDTPASIQLMSEQTATETVSQVTAVPVVALGGTQVATAVRLQDGTLKIIGWKMESNGGITRWVDASAGAITAVSAAPVRTRTIVTASREGDGRFRASYWRFPTTESGVIENRGDGVEGPIGFQVRCAHLPGVGTNYGDTVAAVQTTDGKLRLLRYKVTDV